MNSASPGWCVCLPIARFARSTRLLPFRCMARTGKRPSEKSGRISGEEPPGLFLTGVAGRGDPCSGLNNPEEKPRRGESDTCLEPAFGDGRRNPPPATEMCHRRRAFTPRKVSSFSDFCAPSSSKLNRRCASSHFCSGVRARIPRRRIGRLHQFHTCRRRAIAMLRRGDRRGRERRAAALLSPFYPPGGRATTHEGGSRALRAVSMSRRIRWRMRA